MKSILVATDHSKGALNAEKYAKQIALAKNLKVIYLHVINLPIVDPTLSANLIPETVESLKNEAAEVFSKKIEEDALQGIQSSYQLSFNEIIDTIHDLSEKEEIELVVVGKTGQRTFLDRILGSTAESLINKIKFPLLIVPEEFGGNIFEKLAYATQLQFSENKYIQQTLSWKPKTDNNIVIAHVLEKFPLNIKVSQEFIDAIHAAFKYEGYELKEFNSDFYTEGMTDVIKNEGISLLFVTTHKRGFLEGIIEPSKTKSLINKLSIPVIVYSFES